VVWLLGAKFCGRRTKRVLLRVLGFVGRAGSVIGIGEVVAGVLSDTSSNKKFPLWTQG